MTPEPFVTSAEVSQFLSKKLSWIYDHMHEIPHHKIGNHYRFRLTEIAAWVEGRGVDR